MKECHAIDEYVIPIDGKTLRGSYDKVRRWSGIDVTVTGFLAAMFRYAIITFTVIAVMGGAGLPILSR